MTHRQYVQVWEVSAAGYASQRLTTLLDEGWEPFAAQGPDIILRRITTRVITKT